MGLLDLVKLTALMDRTSGRAEISVGLIDGPVLLTHPDLASEHIREVPGKLRGTCARSDSFACMHGTFVAGILSAHRGSTAPAICPLCSFLLRPIFSEASGLDNIVPSASPQALAEAIIDTVDAGAHIINLSSALAQPSPKGESKLEEALNYAAHHGAIIVAAAGNQGTMGSSAITRHPWVIPVVSCDGNGLPTSESNLSDSIGRRGLRAPGQNITSLGT
jgi:subtilisin family serine protease